MGEGTLSKPNRANWSIATAPANRGLYALALVDITNVVAGAQLTAMPGTESAQETTEFVFTLNPRSMDLEEPASMTITPTQGESQFIEHQGSIYKNISISGTTGVRPSKKSTALIPVVGVPNPFSSPETSLPADEYTGFDDLIRLRNLMRKYFDAKTDPAIAYKICMVWQNGKEGEFYIVEPKVFRTRRSSSNPLAFEYEIQLQTIRRVDYRMLNPPKDDHKERNSINKFNERISEYTRKLSTSIAQINAIMDRSTMVIRGTTTTVITPMTTFTTGTKASIDSVFGPANEILNSLVNVSAAVYQTANFNTYRGMLKDLNKNCMVFMDHLTSTEVSNAFLTQGIVTPFSTLYNATKKIAMLTANIYNEDALFDESQSQKFAKKTAAYINPDSGFRPPITGGSATALQNVRPMNGTAFATVATNDTIYSLSLRLLGDQARWKELVILNNLKHPYVATDGDSTNVLKPGDKILFPTVGGAIQSGVVPDANKQLTPGTQYDPLINKLGRDLKLTACGDGTYDLTINSKGDLETVEGVDNMIQALHLRFSTEQGTLPLHPTYGVAAPIGSKALVRSLVGFQLNVRSSVLSDSRIKNIDSIVFAADGNTLNVSAKLAIADVDQSLNLSFNTKR